MPARTFAISQPNSMVSALTAVGSQSISTGLISRRQFSEIRLVRRRHSGAPSMEVFIRVFGADHFRPLALAPITHAGRPRLGENAVILDGELKLQSVALVVRVARTAASCRAWTRTAAQPPPPRCGAISSSPAPG